MQNILLEFQTDNKNSVVNLKLNHQSDNLIKIERNIVQNRTLLEAIFDEDIINLITSISDLYKDVNIYFDLHYIERKLNKLGMETFMKYNKKVLLNDDVISHILKFNVKNGSVGKFISKPLNKMFKDKNFTEEEIVSGGPNYIKLYGDKINMENICDIAAKCGNLESLKWALSQNPPYKLSKLTPAIAAGNNNLHIIKWLRSQDPPCPWDSKICSFAALNGYLHIIQWARSQNPPCPWNENTCEYAAENGHLNIIQWVRSQDPPCQIGRAHV